MPRTTGGVPKEILREREQQSWALRQRGFTHQRIADQLGLDRSTITKMLGRLSARVNAKLGQEITEHKMAQLEQLSFIIDECMQAWERSKESQKSVSKKTTDAGKLTGRKAEEILMQTEDQDGNIRYITEARAAMADIRKILDIDAPIRNKQEISGVINQPVNIRVIYDDK